MKRKAETDDALNELDLTEFAEQDTAQELQDLTTDLNEFTEIMDLTTSAIEDANLANFRIVDGILVPNDQPLEVHLINPPAPLPAFAPYLTADNGAGDTDLGMYLHYLKSSGKTKKTITEYGIDLRLWKTHLHGELTIEQINTVLKAFNAWRSQRMKYVLNSYAKYRNFHGDQKLLILLSTAIALHKPKIIHSDRKPTDRLNRKEAETYRAQAQVLCKDGKRHGIWIALLLLGVPSGSLYAIELINKSTVRFLRRGQTIEAKIGKWLYDAMTTIPEDQWRVKRHWLQQELKTKYQVTGRALNSGRKLLNAP